MWKSMLLIALSVPLAICAAIIAWISINFRAGIIAGCSVLAICIIAATLMLFFLKRFSLVDVFLPLIFSVIWSVALIPVTLPEAVFSVPTAIGSGFILTMCLWRVYHDPRVGKGWLIFPIIVYMYEMLPVNIPGPFDDIFAFGGDVICGILFYSVTSFRRQLPE